MIIALLTHLFSVCCISLVVSLMLSTYMLHYPVMHLLSEKERATVSMKTMFNLERLKIVSILMIVRCDAIENYMFFRDSQLV